MIFELATPNYGKMTTLDPGKKISGDLCCTVDYIVSEIVVELYI